MTAYLLLPTVGPARTIAYPAFGLIGALAIVFGIYRGRPARARAWWLIALAFGLISLVDIAYSIAALGGAGLPYPSYADIGYLGGYASLLVGTLGLVRGRASGGDRTPFLDAAILAAGAGSILWVAIIRPSLQGGVDPLSAAVSLAYPTLDILLLVLGIRVFLTGQARPRYLQFLLAGLSLYLAADVIYAMEILNANYVYGSPVDAGWIAGVLLIAVGALHPSVGASVSTVEANVTGVGRLRLAFLGVAALIAPTILMVHGLQTGEDIVTGLGIQWILLFSLVLVRLASTVDELAGSLRHRRQLQSDLAHQANHDALTGLANRALFEARLEAAVATAPDTTAVIFLDLDDFKVVNDSFGHPAGDELLRTVGDRLQRGLRGTDLAARLGGDEFAVLIESCDDPRKPWMVAERLLTMLRAPADIGARQILPRASAGVASGHADSTGMELMRDADIAMYRAKSSGKNHVEAYEAAMHTAVVRDYELRAELAAAIESEAFVLHYQPVVNLDSGVVAGAEALVRWNHPERGLVGPIEFIPQAESSGLIHVLGKWILREACGTAAAWPRRMDGKRPFISVNISATQLLQPGLVDEVADALAESGLPPDRLILEVTESALVDLEVARVALHRLRGVGVQLALDDFGTGYSGLSYLAQLPFNIVKIDRAFIAHSGRDSRNAALLDGILGLCDSLELVTVAEGIELPLQLERLRSRGCVFGQGFLFARALPPAEFGAFLDRPRLVHVHPPSSATSPATRSSVVVSA